MNLEALRTLFATDYFATELCGIRIDAVSAHGAKCSMPLTRLHFNANGTVQGGAIYTLCDTVFSAAANAGDRLTVSRSADITISGPGKAHACMPKPRRSAGAAPPACTACPSMTISIR